MKDINARKMIANLGEEFGFEINEDGDIYKYIRLESYKHPATVRDVEYLENRLGSLISELRNDLSLLLDHFHLTIETCPEKRTIKKKKAL